MSQKNGLIFDAGKAICYSGFRQGQNPGTGDYPSYQEVREDLLILAEHWSYLRLYDCDQHAETVLQVIEAEQFDFKVMLGAYIVAEEHNERCPWEVSYTEQEFLTNRETNVEKIKKLISLANQYPDIIFSLSAGNEATVDWTGNMVSVERVIEFVRMIKAGAPQPVTFCENYVPWLDKLKPLGEEVDFISIHSYPVWEYKGIDEAMHYTIDNYRSVAACYPDKPVVITEAGWATNSNGRGIEPENVGQEFQQIYYDSLVGWSEAEGILTFVFEAFDEDWKGSHELLEPEKHWGLYTIDRKPKKVMQAHYQDL